MSFLLPGFEIEEPAFVLHQDVVMVGPDALYPLQVVSHLGPELLKLSMQLGMRFLQPVHAFFKPRHACFESVHACFKPVHTCFKPVHAFFKPIHAGFEPAHAFFKPIHARFQGAHAVFEPFHSVLQALHALRELRLPGFQPFQARYGFLNQAVKRPIFLAIQGVHPPLPLAFPELVFSILLQANVRFKSGCEPCEPL